MSDVRFRNARSSFVVLALLGIVSCSGGGSEVASVASSAGAVPTAALAATVRAPEAALAAPDATFGGVLDAVDLAALATPATSDVAPVGDAVEPLAAGMTLSGSYHGLVNEWSNGLERFGGMSMTLDRSGSSVSGSGLARSGSQTLSLTITGSVLAQYPHSVEVELSAAGPNGCPVTGVARRYRHVFEGVVSSPTCGAFQTPITYYFKVHPQ